MLIIHQIAEYCGVEIANRAAMDSFYYDGKTIAGFTEIGMPLSDEDLLHEISHFVAATDEERCMPEYGMVPRPSSICKGRGERRAAYTARVQEVLTKEERNIRELATQVVNMRLGMQSGILSVFKFCKSWKEADATMAKVVPEWESKGESYLKTRGIQLTSLNFEVREQRIAA